jgi:hypothetical protein
LTPKRQDVLATWTRRLFPTLSWSHAVVAVVTSFVSATVSTCSVFKWHVEENIQSLNDRIDRIEAEQARRTETLATMQVRLESVVMRVDEALLRTLEQSDE